MKKSICVSLLLLVSFVCSLPRTSEGAVLGPLSVSGASRLSGTSAWLVHPVFRSPWHIRLDSRLLHIRKFRRRRSSLSFNLHLQQAYLSAPSMGKDRGCMPSDVVLLSHLADPLVHPPA